MNSASATLENLRRPENELLIDYLRSRARSDPPACSLPEDFENPYYELGSHPDVVERIWDQLGGALPVACNRVVYGIPGLVCPSSGVVLALALGTTYGLRIHESNRGEALSLGFEQSHFYSTAREHLSLARSCGPDWFFGSWDERELVWIQNSLSHAT